MLLQHVSDIVHILELNVNPAVSGLDIVHCCPFTDVAHNQGLSTSDTFTHLEIFLWVYARIGI